MTVFKRAVTLSTLWVASAASLYAQAVAVADLPIECWPTDAHRFVETTFVPPADALTLKLYFRSVTEPDFHFVEATTDRRGRAVAILPIARPETRQVVFFAELVTRSYVAVRTAARTVPTMSQSECSERDPAAAWYQGSNADITVGATRPGVPMPNGFRPDGISRFVEVGSSTGGGGGSSLPWILGGGGGAAAVGAFTLGGGGNEPDTGAPIGGGGLTTTTAVTTTVGGGGTTTVTTTAGGGGPAPPTTSLPGPTTSSTSGPTTSTSGPTTSTPGSTTSSPGSTTSSPTTSVATTSVPTTSVPTTTTPATTTTTAATANVVATKSDNADPVNVGDTVIYTIRITNNGPGRARSVRATEVVPPGMSLIAANPDCGIGGTCLCGAMDPGDSCEGQFFMEADTPGVKTNVVNLSWIHPNDTFGDGSASESTTVITSQKAGEAPPTLTLSSSLFAEAGSDETRGQMVVNETTVLFIQSGSPVEHRLKGRLGSNTMEARLWDPRATGRWRFDFSSTRGFSPGSLVVESGRTLASEGASVTFAVEPDSGPIRFRFEVTSRQ